MSVTIRLARFGKKFAPSYKIVVANTRDKRNGNFLDILGYYNPSENPVKFDMDKEKYSKWINNGALVTDAVLKIVDGTYVYIPYKGLVKEVKEEKDVKGEQSAKAAPIGAKGAEEDKTDKKIEVKQEEVPQETSDSQEKTEENANNDTDGSNENEEK
jgi:small subunit ribosomal protein S16